MRITASPSPTAPSSRIVSTAAAAPKSSASIQVPARCPFPTVMLRTGSISDLGSNMSTTHTVLQGECLSSIAHDFGFGDWHVIYDHPQNASFKTKRPNPNLIYPGDELFIPDLTP